MFSPLTGTATYLDPVEFSGTGRGRISSALNIDPLPRHWLFDAAGLDVRMKLVEDGKRHPWYA